MSTTTDAPLKDGVYKSDVAVYFVKDERIIMKNKGGWHKTTKNFMFGDWKHDLTEGMINEFDNVYDKIPKW